MVPGWAWVPQSTMDFSVVPGQAWVPQSTMDFSMVSGRAWAPQSLMDIFNVGLGPPKLHAFFPYYLGGPGYPCGRAFVWMGFAQTIDKQCGFHGFRLFQVG